MPLRGEQAALSASNWWNSSWSFRVPITINAAGYARSEKPVNVAINFAALLADLGVGGTVNRNSLYLHEVNSSGVIINANVPFQYDPPLNPASPESLTILLQGTTAANAQRTYHLYFDVEGADSFTPQTVSPLVTFTDNVTDEGWASYKIQTDQATYFYHKQGGGFSSLLDKNGNDWISYSAVPEAAGDYRGIPNLVHPSDGGYFHPGRTGIVSSILSKGPLKAVIYSHTADKAWETLWEIYPAYARLTVIKAATNYWFLYEGTPGGILETASDFNVRPDGTQTLTETTWKGDLSPEWVYFSDPTINRSLFFAHHEDDAIVDSYRPMDGLMTVFGFGRDGSSRFLSKVPSLFTFGLKDGVELTTIKSAINSAYRDVSITVGRPESQLSYTLVVNKQGNGQVNVDPVKAKYSSGEQVTLEAIADPGWVFKKWTGDLTGSNPKTTIVVKDDMQITAVFEKEQYTLTIVTEGGGKVIVDPLKTTYLYQEIINLEAVADAGWAFKEWQGDLTGEGEKATIEITDDMQISAIFDQDQYSLTIEQTGMGSVSKSPDKAFYLHGDEVVLEAKPVVGWIFGGWEGDISGDDEKVSLTITGDLMVHAHFKEPKYYLPVILTD